MKNPFAKDNAFQREYGPMIARKRRARERLAKAFLGRGMNGIEFEKAAGEAAKSEIHELHYKRDIPKTTYITYKGLVQIWVHVFRNGDLRKAGARRKTNG